MGKVVVVGAGLAGSEAAYFLANLGHEIILIEGKKNSPNPAQKMTTAAELVCTNSLKSLSPISAHGLLKLEMEKLGSLILSEAHKARVPAGDALAVDRELFSQGVHSKLLSHQKITLVEKTVDDPEEIRREYGADFVLLATGPLTSCGLQQWLKRELSSENLYFYDAIAPVVDAQSLQMEKLYFKDRHKERVLDKQEADYLNAPMTKDQYVRFMEELKGAEKVPPKDFEDPLFFESCLPIDLMAERGIETARFGPMTPMGLQLPDGTRPYAVVQLRRENLLGEAFNLVGFQTRLTYKEQLRVFRMIPGLENAEFFHLGSVHRNTFLNSSQVLSFDMNCKKYPWLWVAGQMTGVEGYTESAASGLYVAFQIQRGFKGMPSLRWPVETAMGSLINYIMTWERPRPSNFNFGLLPSLGISKKDLKGDRKKMKKELMVKRAQLALENFWKEVEHNSPGETQETHVQM